MTYETLVRIMAVELVVIAVEVGLLWGRTFWGIA